MSEPNPRGRPSSYSAELAVQICERMANGESLRSICRDSGMPAEATVRGWALENREGFSAHYAMASELRMDYLGDDVLEIADNVKGDPQRDRLRVDTRKWLMSKIAPKRFGERVSVGGDPENPLIPEDPSTRDLAKAVLALLGKGVKPE